MASNPQPLRRPPPAPGVRGGAFLSAAAALGLAGWTVDRMAMRRDLGMWAGRVESTTCGALAGAQLDPGIRHLVLDGCQLDLASATVVYDGVSLDAVYAPLRVSDGPTLGDIPVLVRMEDAHLRATLLEYLRMTPPPDPGPWFAEHIDPHLVTIDGAVLGARHRTATDVDHLQRHRAREGGEVVLLAERRHLPSPWPPGLGSLLFGVLAVWGLCFPPSGIVAGTGRT